MIFLYWHCRLLLTTFSGHQGLSKFNQKKKKSLPRCLIHSPELSSSPEGDSDTSTQVSLKYYHHLNTLLSFSTPLMHDCTSLFFSHTFLSFPLTLCQFLSCHSVCHCCPHFTPYFASPILSIFLFLSFSLSHFFVFWSFYLFASSFISLLPGSRLRSPFLLCVSFIIHPVSLFSLSWVCFNLLLFSPPLTSSFPLFWHFPLQAVTVSSSPPSFYQLFLSFSLPPTSFPPPSLSFCSSALSSRHSAV